MQILDLHEAAKLLKMNPEVLRRKAKAAEIPGRKVGKHWLFVKQHLADWISGRYPENGRNLRVIDGGKQTKETQACQSINAVKRGGYNTPTQTANAYNALLGRKTEKKRKNYTTD